MAPPSEAMEQRVSPSAESPFLIAQSGPRMGERWVLSSEGLLVGRGEECDIVIADRQISRHHARFRRTPEGVVVEDLGSKNGTHLNGVRIAGPTLLQDGDVVQVAYTLELAYVGRDATLPLEGIGFGRRGKLRMDSGSHQVWVGERELVPPLSAPQYRLLEGLYQHAARVVSREEVVRLVWPEAEGSGVSEQAIDALIRRLRDRIAELDPGHRYIVTVRGHGFRLDNPPGV